MTLFIINVENENTDPQYYKREDDIPGDGEPVDDVSTPAHEAGYAAQEQRVEEWTAEHSAERDVGVKEHGLTCQREFGRAAAERVERARGQVLVHVELLRHLPDRVRLLLPRQDRQPVEDLHDCQQLSCH